VNWLRYDSRAALRRALATMPRKAYAYVCVNDRRAELAFDDGVSLDRFAPICEPGHGNVIRGSAEIW
jgi:hypothetical protein